ELFREGWRGHKGSVGSAVIMSGLTSVSNHMANILMFELEKCYENNKPQFKRHRDGRRSGDGVLICAGSKPR
ncbi:MAG: hypothetical protein WAV82_01265, partial [Methylobacter sp.]